MAIHNDKAISKYRVSQKTVNPFKQLYFMNQSTYLIKLKWKAETLTILKVKSQSQKKFIETH